MAAWGSPMTRTFWMLPAGLALGLAASSAGAQGRAADAAAARARSDAVFQRSLFFEKDVRDRLEAVTPAEQKALIEWGGYYNPSYNFYNDFYDEGVHQTRQNLRLWTRMRFDKVHHVFARMRLEYIDFATGDAEVGGRDHDLEGPNLEIGYYELDLSDAMEQYFKQKWPAKVTVRGGRQYLEVGRGIALGKILDAGRVDIDSKMVSLTFFGGHTPDGEDNIDRSAPGYTNSHRSFYGTQLRYTALEQHEPYAYFLVQRDYSYEVPEDPWQDYRYQSFYYGGGSRGELVRNLRYEVELLGQGGRSAAAWQEGSSEAIRAWAFNSELDYYVDHAIKPVLALEYGYASGDSDRQLATMAYLGNKRGTADQQFQGFGYINTGLALGARFSNLQFLRMGGRVRPYDKKTGYGRLDIGANYYFLFKADADGPISDTRAIGHSADIGQEVDLFLEWRILSDLSWTVHYGRFFPGNAYPGHEPARNFLYTGLNFSF